VPGAVLLVRGPDGVILREAYGLRQGLPAELPMTRETLFDLASLTKPVCASLLTLIMVQRGSLDLDQDLEAWFSPVKDPAKRRITVRQLLSNRSGLPGWRPFYQEYPADRQFRPGVPSARVDSGKGFRAPAGPPLSGGDRPAPGTQPDRIQESRRGFRGDGGRR